MAPNLFWLKRFLLVPLPPLPLPIPILLPRPILPLNKKTQINNNLERNDIRQTSSSLISNSTF